MKADLPHYRKLLQEELECRQKRNAGYSLRAFARDLAMPASKVSEVMRGICGLSPKSGFRIARKLRLSPEETRWFIQSIEANHSRSTRARARAQSELQATAARNGFDELSLERFKIVSDWHYFALLELTETKGFQSDPTWIAKRLKISEAETRASIERLIDFGLLERDENGDLRQTQRDFSVPGGIPSREIRKHHTQILQKAEESLTSTDLTERDFSAMTMAVAQSQLPEARKLIREFRRQFDRILKTSTDPKDRVFILGIQFFPVDQTHQNKETS